MTILLSWNKQSGLFPRKADSDLSTATCHVRHSDYLLPWKTTAALASTIHGQVHWSLLLQRFQRIRYLTPSPKLSLSCPLWASETPIPMLLPCCPLDPHLWLPSAASRKVEQTSTRSNERRAWLVTLDGSETIFLRDKTWNGCSRYRDTQAWPNQPYFAKWPFNAHSPPKQDSYYLNKTLG